MIWPLIFVIVLFCVHTSFAGGDGKSVQVVQSGNTSQFRQFSKNIAPVSDIWPEMCTGPHTPSVIRTKVRYLASMGFKRLYFVVPPPGYAAFSLPNLDIFPVKNAFSHFGLESIIMTGDPCTHFVAAAHEAGIEAFAVLKIYEGGSGHTLPHGREHPVRRRFLTEIGGDAHAFDPFILDNPAMRVRRKPIPGYENLMNQPVIKLELAFPLEEARQETWNDRFIEYPRQPDSVIMALPVQGFQIWLSSDNGRYRLLQTDYNMTERLEVRPVPGANGEELIAGGGRFRVLAVTGLHISPDIPYLAVVFENRDKHHVMIPQSMIRAWGPKGEIPLTCTSIVRYPATPGLTSGDGNEVYTFKDIGFEFDWHGLGFFGPGWNSSEVYGIAKGKNEYMKGTLCEAYPEVREHWLREVRRLLEMGVDGIDFRLQNHSAMVSDYASYGYNEPIVEEYRRRHGVDILTQEADPLEIMRIRGDFFLLFLEDAAKEIKSKNRRLQIHFRNALENPRLSYRYVELGGWPLPKILPDWRRMVELADEVTIKDMNMGTYHPELSDQIKRTAHEMGKPVWVHCYLSQGNDLNPEFCDAVDRDSRVTGMLLYEVHHSRKQDNPRGGGLIGVDAEGKLFFNNPMIKAVNRLMNVH